MLSTEMFLTSWSKWRIVPRNMVTSSSYLTSQFESDLFERNCQELFASVVCAPSYENKWRPRWRQNKFSVCYPFHTDPIIPPKWIIVRAWLVVHSQTDQFDSQCLKSTTVDVENGWKALIQPSRTLRGHSTWEFLRSWPLWSLLHSLNAGFTVGNTACCGAGMYGGGDRCLTPAMACENPGDFVWWDKYHPSHKASHIIASQIWSGTDQPIDISDGLSPAHGVSFITLQELALLDLDLDH